MWSQFTYYVYNEWKSFVTGNSLLVHVSCFTVLVPVWFCQMVLFKKCVLLNIGHCCVLLNNQTLCTVVSGYISIRHCCMLLD